VAQAAERAQVGRVHVGGVAVDVVHFGRCPAARTSGPALAPRVSAELSGADLRPPAPVAALSRRATASLRTTTAVLAPAARRASGTPWSGAWLESTFH
jgi:hypothetical protein